MLRRFRMFRGVFVVLFALVLTGETGAATATAPNGGPFLPMYVSGLSAVTIAGLSRPPATASLENIPSQFSKDWVGTVEIPQQGGDVTGKLLELESQYTTSGYSWTIEYDLEYLAPKPPPLGQPCQQFCPEGSEDCRRNPPYCCPETHIRLLVQASDTTVHTRSLGHSIGPGDAQPLIGGPVENGWFILPVAGEYYGTLTYRASDDCKFQKRAHGFYTFMGEDNPALRPTHIRLTSQIGAAAYFSYQISARVQRVPRLNIGSATPETATILDLGAADQVTWNTGNLLLQEPHRFVAFYLQPGADLHCKVASDPGGKISFFNYDKHFVATEKPCTIPGPGSLSSPEGEDIVVLPASIGETAPKWAIVGLKLNNKDVGSPQQVAMKMGWYWTPGRYADANISLNPGPVPPSFPTELNEVYSNVVRMAFSAGSSCTSATLPLAPSSERTPPHKVWLRLNYKAAGGKSISLAVFDKSGNRIFDDRVARPSTFDTITTGWDGYATYAFEASDIPDGSQAPLEIRIQRPAADAGEVTVETKRYAYNEPAAQPPFSACQIRTPKDGSRPTLTQTTSLPIQVTAIGPTAPKQVVVSATCGAYTTEVATITSSQYTFQSADAPGDCRVQNGSILPTFSCGLDFADETHFPSGQSLTLNAEATFEDGNKTPATPVTVQIPSPVIARIVEPLTLKYFPSPLKFQVEAGGGTGVTKLVANLSAGDQELTQEIVVDPAAEARTMYNFELNTTDRKKFQPGRLASLAVSVTYKDTPDPVAATGAGSGTLGGPAPIFPTLTLTRIPNMASGPLAAVFLAGTVPQANNYIKVTGVAAPFRVRYKINNAKRYRGVALASRGIRLDTRKIKAGTTIRVQVQVVVPVVVVPGKPAKLTEANARVLSLTVQ
jgi:hypothetical protein